VLSRTRRLLRWLARATRQAPRARARSRYLHRRYAGLGGARDYKLFVPVSWRGSGPLLVMLHGCRQGPDDFAAGTRMNALAEAGGFLVAWPAQSRLANGLRCWNWFEPAHQARGAGEPAIIAGIANEVAEEFGADRRRIFVAGLSAGGAMAAVLGETYPELFAAVGVHSGVPYGAASDLRSAMAAMAGKSSRPRSGSARAIVFHGDNDSTVHHDNGMVPVAQPPSKLGWVHRERAVEVLAGEENGRRYTRTVLKDASGRVLQEHWLVHGAGHAWSGGSPEGTYADPRGPDASREMLRFFQAVAAQAQPVMPAA
jgi:poly(hydroxyalkanoate) depolymerase family esterase